MRLSIRDTPEQVGLHVSIAGVCRCHFAHAAPLQIGDYLAKRINEFKPSAEKPHFVLGLPTGSSPLPTYQRLVELVQSGDLSLKVRWLQSFDSSRLTSSLQLVTERRDL